jgi:mannose-6-phosphate isomerase-like protein (cupin superfamily)
MDFHASQEIAIAERNGGAGVVKAKMAMRPKGKIIPCRIPAGGSIGLHRHETSDEISGRGKAVCGGIEAPLAADVYHICPKGCAHSIVITGEADLALLTVVVER